MPNCNTLNTVVPHIFPSKLKTSNAMRSRVNHDQNVLLLTDCTPLRTYIANSLSNILNSATVIKNIHVCFYKLDSAEMSTIFRTIIHTAAIIFLANLPMIQRAKQSDALRWLCHVLWFCGGQSLKASRDRFITYKMISFRDNDFWVKHHSINHIIYIYIYIYICMYYI